MAAKYFLKVVLNDPVKFDTGPEFDGVYQVKVLEKADKEGWEGYYWAHPILKDGKIDKKTHVLVHKEDLKNAKNKKPVPAYVPGIFGFTKKEDLIEHLLEYEYDDNYVVVIFKGEEIGRREKSSFFAPDKIIGVYPISSFLLQGGDEK